MAPSVAHDHGGNGVGDSPPHLRQIGTSCRESGARKRNGQERQGWMQEGRASSHEEPKAQKAMENYSPQEINFNQKDQKTFVHVSKNVAWFSNFVSELVKEFLMHSSSWYDIEDTKKAYIQGRLMVTNIQKKTKTNAKRTKPSTRMERA
ncbi:hypothetical protein Tco_0437726 [Tanacetum coccineum]